MEAIRSSETSVQSTTSTRRHTPEDGILHSHRRENLKSYILFLLVSIHVPNMIFSYSIYEIRPSNRFRVIEAYHILVFVQLPCFANSFNIHPTTVFMLMNVTLIPFQLISIPLNIPSIFCYDNKIFFNIIYHRKSWCQAFPLRNRNIPI
jgi:hypothetical protein